jgi:Transposase DDE domain group 1
MRFCFWSGFLSIDAARIKCGIDSMTLHRDAAAVLEKFGVLFSPSLNLSQVAGLEPFLAFLSKGKFRDRWAAQFGVYRSRSMMQFVLGLVVGARSMDEIGKIGKDPLIKRFVENPVEEAQLGRDVRSFDRTMIEQLHDLVMSYSIFDFAKSIAHGERLIFDVDATSVVKFGSQEGVEAGYVAKDRIEDCYQYLFFRLHNRNSFLYGTIRAGSTHSQNDFCGYLERFLPLLKRQWQSAWRCDSGYFNENAFDLFSENDATFFIKAPMSVTRLSLASTSPDLIWSPDEDGVSYASRTTVTGKGTKYREIFKRKRLEPENGQLALGAGADYRFDCLAANDLFIDDEKAFEFYNGRANIENNIKELKQDYHLGKIVTDSFDANDVITQLTMLTYLLMRHFQNEVLPQKMQRMQLSTLRTKLFNIPGRLLVMQRRAWTRIQNVFTDEATYASIFKALEKIRSWILEPPDLAFAA